MRWEPATERFARKITPPNESGCVLWQAATNRGGYGIFRGHGRAVLAHRFAWEQANGPVPDGLQLDHLCRVRHCVNPDHLEVVTLLENYRRGNSGKHQAAKTHCPHGHAYDETNTYRLNGHRHCRSCMNERSRAWYRRNIRGIAS